MRIELCRHCGEETIEADKCAICHEIYKFVCPECNIIFDNFHSNCTEKQELGKIIID